MVERISSTSQYEMKQGMATAVPAGSNGFELMIWVSRNGASTDCLDAPPVTTALLNADMTIGFQDH